MRIPLVFAHPTIDDKAWPFSDRLDLKGDMSNWELETDIIIQTIFIIKCNLSRKTFRTMSDNKAG